MLPFCLENYPTSVNGSKIPMAVLKIPSPRNVKFCKFCKNDKIESISGSVRELTLNKNSHLESSSDTIYTDLEEEHTSGREAPKKICSALIPPPLLS